MGGSGQKTFSTSPPALAGGDFVPPDVAIGSGTPTNEMWANCPPLLRLAMGNVRRDF